MAEFWSELLGSVLSFFGLLTQSRRGSIISTMCADESVRFADFDTGAASAMLDTPSAPATPMWVQAKDQLATLQRADPAFLEATFLSQAAKTYSAMLAAEAAMDVSGLHDLATKNFLDGMQQRIDAWHAGGFTHVVSDVTLDPGTIFKVTIGAQSQAICVRFTGSAKRFTREDMTNLISDGSIKSTSFSEFATFVRPAGSTTPRCTALSGALHCQSCGAPVSDGALRCTFCGAPVSGSGGTWRLDHTSLSAYT